MRIKPIRPVYHSADKDERHEAEKRRMSLLLRLLESMRIPQSRTIGLSLPTQRLSALQWLGTNLVVNNKDHENFRRANNLVKLLIASEVRRKNERL